MLTAARSEKSSLGTSRDLAVAEVEALYPTFSMPVSIALFDLGAPVISNGEEEGGDENGISVHADEGKEARKLTRKREDSNQTVTVFNRPVEFKTPVADPRRNKTSPLPAIKLPRSPLIKLSVNCDRICHATLL